MLTKKSVLLPDLTLWVLFFSDMKDEDFTQDLWDKNAVYYKGHDRVNNPICMYAEMQYLLPI